MSNTSSGTPAMWHKDTSRFGVKMMQKMGWKSGVGLGLRENGTVTHLRVDRKYDTLGIGADKNKDWQDVINNYDILLSNLNKNLSNGTTTETHNDDDDDDDTQNETCGLGHTSALTAPLSAKPSCLSSPAPMFVSAAAATSSSSFSAATSFVSSSTPATPATPAGAVGGSVPVDRHPLKGNEKRTRYKKLDRASYLHRATEEQRCELFGKTKSQESQSQSLTSAVPALEVCPVTVSTSSVQDYFANLAAGVRSGDAEATTVPDAGEEHSHRKRKKGQKTAEEPDSHGTLTKKERRKKDKEQKEKRKRKAKRRKITE
eukprot:gnl/Hemi2/22742_TR7608_c0_g1_i1.p1 gnl/Hemi2/22742_TR7608_c0_g1~~gnl/Hemi2/22742_TR7608_c0_g1_i1.p1  ORF type:complete len:316 (-),score=59.35 gnl/Hemi2/22742_TR7608_c0_g1_i1:61-1008(-)